MCWVALRISKSEFQNNDQKSKQNPSAKLKAQNAPKESLRLPTGQAKLQLKAKSEIFLFFFFSFKFYAVALHFALYALSLK